MKDSTVISLTREEAQAAWDNSPRAKAKRVAVGDLLICRTDRFDPPTFRIVEVIGAGLSSEANGGGWLKVKAMWHEGGARVRVTRPSFDTIDNGDYRAFTPLPVEEKRPRDFITDALVGVKSAENYLRAEAILAGEKPIDIWCTLNNIFDEAKSIRAGVGIVAGEAVHTSQVLLKEFIEIAKTNQQTQAAILGELCAMRQIWEGGKK